MWPIIYFLLALVFFGVVLWLLWPDTFFVKRTFSKKKKKRIIEEEGEET